MSALLLLILGIIQWMFLLILALSSLYIFIFGLAGLFYRQPAYGTPRSNRRIAVLIPGYKEDNVIVETASEALNQDYATADFEVIVIADSFGKTTLEKLKSLPVRLIEVSFDKSTKSKALNRAMEVLGDKYDIALVLDADNIMERDFLSRINKAFEKPITAVQGHRKAKNMNTSFAVLDAISEEINNHIFRKGHRVLGLSSAIIGSGMAFRYGYFRKLMQTVTAVGGFDKEIELKMLAQGHTIEYLEDAIVFDEKVQKPEVFSNQRKRWLSAQFHYFRLYFLPSLIDLFRHGNFDYFDKALQFILPPRILLLASVLTFGSIFLVTGIVFSGPVVLIYLWITTMILCFLAFLFSVPGSFYNRKTLQSMASLPHGLILMVGSLISMKGANRQFIHTEHGSISPDETFQKKL